jgi:hypothetical protein
MLVARGQEVEVAVRPPTLRVRVMSRMGHGLAVREVMDGIM